MYFRLGGGTVRGVARPGPIVWSRIFVEGSRLKMDLGRAEVLALPQDETERRWQATTPQWPMMHMVLYGVSRDQMMARHKANHIQVAYAHSAEEADLAQLAELASRVASTLPGLTIPEALAEVARTPALHVRFVEERRGATEDYGWGRITALIQGNMVTKASAG